MLKYIVIAAVALSIGACSFVVKPGTLGATGGVAVNIKPGAPKFPDTRGDGQYGQVQVDGFKDPTP